MEISERFVWGTQSEYEEIGEALKVSPSLVAACKIVKDRIIALYSYSLEEKTLWAVWLVRENGVLRTDSIPTKMDGLWEELGKMLTDYYKSSL